jgi:hypothetical protein
MLSRGVPIDHVQAARLYKLSGDQKFAHAQFNYGYCLACGIGVDVDRAAGVEWFKCSADNGDALGEYYYGYCLEHGIEVERNHVMAVDYYRHSAGQGYQDAQFQLATCFLTDAPGPRMKRKRRSISSFQPHRIPHIPQGIITLTLSWEFSASLIWPARSHTSNVLLITIMLTDS